MIVVRLHGGLGNQMFQYAYGLALQRRGREVVFDRSSYDTDALRCYELDVWRVKPRTLRPRDYALLPAHFGGRGWRSWLGGRRPLRRLTERPMGYRPEWLDPPSHVYLNGYWQSEQFFADIAEEVREAFQPALPLSAETERTIMQMKARPSVAVHVRRTDYLKVPMLQVCDGTFHRRCVEDLIAERGDVVAYVFSDDLDWCRANLRLPCDTRYVDHACGDQAWQNLWMMRHCRHHVIPNSTFSWWGAWLAGDARGVTYAPHPWWGDPANPGDDVVPASWRLVAGRAEADRSADDAPLRRAA